MTAQTRASRETQARHEEVQARQATGESPTQHQEAEARLDNLDERLSRTVTEIADTLEHRAELLKQQRRRRGDGGGKAASART